jgi:hypothetical protein
VDSFDYCAESCDVNLLYLPIFLMLILLEMSPQTIGEDSSRSFLFETYAAIATFQAAASQPLQCFTIFNTL